MSGFFVCYKKNGKIKVLSLLIILVLSASSVVFANPLDWFRSSSKSSRSDRNEAEPANQELVSVKLEDNTLTGQNLDPMEFAKTHWDHSRQKLEKVTRAIMHVGANRENSDLLKKLFVINTQVFRESIKNSALAVNEISDGNENLRRQLADLSRIITSPGKETIDRLEKALGNLRADCHSQVVKVKKYLTGSEMIIEIAEKSWDTLELIPSLPVPGTDLTIVTSKQLMKVNQSNSEAFKGLLLNIQSSYDQVLDGLEMIKKTVHETLRFSDHFAIKQFPLINLPAVAREKVYVQLSSLNNNLKGVGNTLSIGDSQVRNTSQQLTHISSALASKVGETLKFASDYDNTSNRQNSQISNYAQNQVAGLYQRIKDDIRQMRSDMQLAGQSSRNNPEVKIETGREYRARRTASVSKDRLPLFLLGSKGSGLSARSSNNATSNLVQKSNNPSKNVKSADFARIDESEFIPLSESNESAKKINTRILYSEKTNELASDLLQSELNILQNELGDNFFFAEVEDNPSASEEYEDPLDEEEELPDHGFMEIDSMQASHDNLDDISEPEIELLKFDMTGSDNNLSEVVPMMRMSDDALMFDDQAY